MADRFWKPGGKLPKVGDLLRLRAHPALHRKWERYQVRAIVDGRFVLRSWHYTKQRWYYEVKSKYAFTVGEFSVDWKKEAANA
jgi:hypothetical protein